MPQKSIPKEIIARLAKLEMDMSFIKDKINSVGDDLLKSEMRELDQSEVDLLNLD